MTARWEASRGCAAAAALSLAAFPSAAFAAARSRLLLVSRSCGQAHYPATRTLLEVGSGRLAPEGTVCLEISIMHRLGKLMQQSH